VPEGLDLAVQKMKKGEMAEVTLAPRYAFGSEGAQRPSGTVPPDATITYTVQLKEFDNVRAPALDQLSRACGCVNHAAELVAVRKAAISLRSSRLKYSLHAGQAKDTWSMSDEEKLEAAKQRKEKGNARFKAGKWAAALDKYKVGRRHCSTSPALDSTHQRHLHSAVTRCLKWHLFALVKGNAGSSSAHVSCFLRCLQSAADLADQAGKDKETLKAEARDVR
jgi:FKBP-type peptidyl-prolyl cis-trans isomerase